MTDCTAINSGAVGDRITITEDGAYIVLAGVQTKLDLTVAASRDAIVMVEGGAQHVSEEVLVDALMFAHKAAQHGRMIRGEQFPLAGQWRGLRAHRLSA